MTPPDLLPPGTRVRTPRHGDGTVIDGSHNPGVYHPGLTWVRLDNGEPGWEHEGYVARVLGVLT